MTKLTEAPAIVHRPPQPKPIDRKPPYRTVAARPSPAPERPGKQILNTSQFIQRYPLPPRTTALGYCEDGLPVLFDLSDARPGPLLVLGDSAAGKTNLVHTMLHSAMHFNTPRDFQYLVISSRPQEYNRMNQSGPRGGHCQGILGTYDVEIGNQIIRLATMAEERYNSHRPSPAVMVIFDDLRFAPGLDCDVRLNFEWLLKHGPGVQIWPVAVLQTQSALDMGRWTSQFRTRLIGKMPERAAHRLSIHAGLRTGEMQAGKQFGVYIDHTWLRFWVPAKEDQEKTGGQDEDRNAVV